MGDYEIKFHHAATEEEEDKSLPPASRGTVTVQPDNQTKCSGHIIHIPGV